MKTKQRYVKPTLEVVSCAHALLDSLSMAISDTPAPGGGDAKKAVMDDDDQWGKVNYHLWED